MTIKRQTRIDWAFRVVLLGLVALWTFLPVQSDSKLTRMTQQIEARR